MARAPLWAPPLLAVQFLTRLPVPALARLDAAAADGFARAMAWLPLVGALIGGVTASIFVAAQALWPPVIAALLALAVEALLTGAFHEDAVADFCDAFGGTARGDRAIEIMRDSRIGSYGALGLGLMVGLRLAAIGALPPMLAAAAIVAAAAVGRLWAVLLVAILPPVATGTAARAGGVPPRRALAALALTVPGVLPLAWLSPLSLLVAAAIGVAVLGWLARFLRRRIGGSTGDCLGFAAYAGQLTLLLAVAAG
ncbi:cobalamin biosynthesis protein CobS [Sphingomonas taxi]|uniref:Adenosylcobinamide-GDP ribazoletransferase n=2 Tax=Sphingomonas TaxID=13687 RepID=A0A097EJN5_9SPHN|nr:adenosylcobinamide-GDP ribazoletransferase [Sphingomonas taxi]AIT07784.1 cobalamin biosynthesis protein CobS [Sphingomonas taxi]